jgi:hypothetical protein
MNPISKLSNNHLAVLLDLWAMIENLDVQNPAIDPRSLDWSVDTCHLTNADKYNITYDLFQMGLLVRNDKLYVFPSSTLNNINKFLFE